MCPLFFFTPIIHRSGDVFVKIPILLFRMSGQVFVTGTSHAHIYPATSELKLMQFNHGTIGTRFSRPVGYSYYDW